MREVQRQISTGLRHIHNWIKDERICLSANLDTKSRFPKVQLWLKASQLRAIYQTSRDKSVLNDLTTLPAPIKVSRKLNKDYGSGFLFESNKLTLV